ncbi:unnamed protein product, partial [Closterium sp. NIES-54]
AGAAGLGGACTRGTGAAGAGGVRGAGARDPKTRGPAARGTRGGGAGATSPGGAGVTAGAGGSGGARAAGPRGARTRDRGAGRTGAGGAGAGGAGAGGPGAGGTGAGGTGAGDPRAGGAGAGDPGAGGAGAGGAGAGGTGAGGTVQRRPFFILPPPSSLPPPVSVLRQPDSPLLAPSPYAKQTDSLTERREPESRPALPVHAVCTGRRVPCPPVPYCPLLSPLAFSLPDGLDPESHLVHAASPTVPCLIATVVTDPSFKSTVASALVAELVDFAVACRLDYAASLVAGSESD